MTYDLMSNKYTTKALLFIVRCLVYMLVQDELNTRELAIHQNNLIMTGKDYSLLF